MVLLAIVLEDIPFSVIGRFGTETDVSSSSCSPSSKKDSTTSGDGVASIPPDAS